MTSAALAATLLAPACSTRAAPAAEAPPPPTTVRAEKTYAAGDKLLVSREVYQGWRYYHVYCDRCHGQDAAGSSFAPNLRHSVSPEGATPGDTFAVVVRVGRDDKGMPPFRQLLDDEQIAQVYEYVKARSEGRLAAGRPHVARGS